MDVSGQVYSPAVLSAEIGPDTLCVGELRQHVAIPTEL
jgi:hypothetical protein